MRASMCLKNIESYSMDYGEIFNLDCIKGMQSMQQAGILADLLLTDIPYDVVNRSSNGLRNLDKDRADDITFELNHFLDLVDKVVSGSFVIFCSTEQVSDIRSYFACKGHTTRVIVWQKNNPSPMNGQHVYLSGIEFAVYAKKRKAVFNAHCKNSVLKHSVAKNKWHPTSKPVSLWSELVEDLSMENQLVLDTCMGGGTTPLVCSKLKRRFICFEINKDYYKLAIERLKCEGVEFVNGS